MHTLNTAPPPTTHTPHNHTHMHIYTHTSSFQTVHDSDLYGFVIRFENLNHEKILCMHVSEIYLNPHDTSMTHACTKSFFDLDFQNTISTKP